jgi:hypothetical protein
LAALALAACLSIPAARADERIKVSTLSGTVSFIRPASPMALVDMSVGQRLLDAALNPEHPLELASQLLDGDGLRTEDPNSAVMLECASGATQTLTGPFDVVLRVRDDGKGCLLQVRQGQVTATTAENPEAMPEGKPQQQYGDVTLGASSTMFGVSVSRGDVECFVIDGVITATRDNTQVWALGAGQQLSVNTRAVSAITDSRLDQVANTYARLDVASLPAAQRSATQMQLKTRYLAAFRQPADAAAREQLVRSYSALGATPNAARAYQARKETILKSPGIDRAGVTQPNPVILANPQ